MNKYVAVRAKTLTEAKTALDKSGCVVVKSNAERIDPAFRNLVEGFHARGMVYDIDGCGVFWLLVEDARSLEIWQAFSAVECVFPEDWFVEQAQKVRYLKGIAYCDATSGWADLYPLKNQSRKIQVQFEKPDELIEPVKTAQSVEEVSAKASAPVEADYAPIAKEMKGEIDNAVAVSKEVCKENNEEGEPRPVELQILSLDLDGEVAPKPIKKKRAAKLKRKRECVVKEEQLDLFALSQVSLLQ